MTTTESTAATSPSGLAGRLRGVTGVRRLLLSRVDLIEDAQAAGLTLSAYMRANAGRIASYWTASLR